VLAAGRGVFELTGFQEGDLMGHDVVEVLTLSDDKPVELVREWGVRQPRRAPLDQDARRLGPSP
jgi:hypothetical protein